MVRIVHLSPEGQPVGRRKIKEYRPSEALALIAADRDQQPLVCPSCGNPSIARTPKRPFRAESSHGGRVTLHCTACDRSAVYTEAPGDRFTSPSAS